MRKSKNNNIVGQLFDAVTEYQVRRQQRGCAFLIGGAAIFAVCAVIMVIVGFIISVVEEGNVVSAYGDEIAALCSPMPIGTVSLDNAPDGEFPRELVLFRAGTRQRHAWHGDLPAAWRAESQEEVGLVGCVEQEEEVVETCEYQRPDPEGGTYPVRMDRIQYVTTVTLVNPETGRPIEALTVEGSAPEACPEYSDDLNTSVDIEGSEVEFEEFTSWLEPFVFGK